MKPTIQFINYTPEPTPKLFHWSNAQRKGIMGPVGSGKSSACCMEILNRSMQQAPDRKGIRRTRWAIIRSTYPQLCSTTIKTWQEWLPQSICPIVYRKPIEGHMHLRLPDKTILDMEVLFIALDKPKDTERLTSMELSGAWINEAREVGPSIVRDTFSRTGRYPPKKVAPLTYRVLLMDTNPPDDDHWWYRLAEDEKPAGWKFWRQPGALIAVRDATGHVTHYEANPLAENVQHQQLGYSYWTDMVAGTDPEWVSVHCCGQYGSVFEGKAVYQGVYNDALHVSRKSLGVFRGRPLFMAFDFGNTPACLFAQLTPHGQLRILRELQCEYGGLKQFVTDAVRPMLAELFPGMPVIVGGDPAGKQRSQADDELSCFGMLENLGLSGTPAPTNDPLPRRQAVMDRLVRMTSDQPAFIIDPSCKLLRRGFLGGYKFERVQVSGEERYRDKPAKNRYSHIHDSLQYLCLLVDSVARVPPMMVPPSQPTWAGMA